MVVGLVACNGQQEASTGQEGPTRDYRPAYAASEQCRFEAETAASITVGCWVEACAMHERTCGLLDDVTCYGIPVHCGTCDGGECVSGTCR